ncbi:MAG: hypothetical protein IKQ32_05540 [Prevotella sp.]|nr:hypothetical protein [Prevotella sp.]
MKRNKILWLCAILISTTLCCSCNSDDDSTTSAKTATRSVSIADRSLYAIARQSSDAIIQHKAEMPVFSLSDIESYNPKTGEIKFKDIAFDKELFYDIACKYRVYFYAGDDLLFDARTVSWLSSAGYFDELTFQCDIYGPSDGLKNSRFFLSYGYPGTIDGDETVKELMKKNEAGMERFVSILRKAGKIVDAE